MTEHSIIVEYEAVEGQADALLAILVEHARRTLEEEPGCLRFEVFQAIERDGAAIPGRLLIDELYDGLDAIAAHEANPRMASVRAAAGPLIRTQRLILSRSVAEKRPQQGLRPEELNAANDD